MGVRVSDFDVSGSPVDDVGLSEGPPWWMVVHIYGFACLFFMLAFYAFFSGMNIRQELQMRKHKRSLILLK